MEPILPLIDKTDKEIQEIFTHYSVALSPDEGRQIVTLLGRNPTLTEATVWGIQGSEHSSYKSSRAYLKKLPVQGEHILLGPGEDSGVLAFHAAQNGKQYALVVAHESHNHPSQVVPFEGAGTGVGGICRDIACMGARVVGVLDALRFGNIQTPQTQRIFAGVTKGISGYANPLGVTNLGGDAFFDASFEENCLVNVVAMGVMDWADIIHSYVPENAARDKYEYILVGKPTDRSGFGGTAFASTVLSEDDKDKNKGAVQEPNPFLERHLFAAFQDLFAQLKERGDLSRIAFKDLGAGGVLCATVELVADQGFGAEITVEDIHVGEENLSSAIILCAETQERFCFAVPPDLTDFILNHFNIKWGFPQVCHGAKASKIGFVTETGIYHAVHNGEDVCRAKATDITEGIVVDRLVSPRKKTAQGESLPNVLLEELFWKTLASENICSRRPYTETYDQTVQGNTILTRDESESGVQTPLRDYDEISEEEKNIMSCTAVAGPPRIGAICPRSQASIAVCQAVLKIAATGGDVLGLTDCLNYGNPEIPEQMWEFAEAIEGLAETATLLNTPFVSGNVSLYNSSPTDSINPSAIIGAFGKIPSGGSPRKNCFQETGSPLFLLGNRSEHLGGSEVLRLFGKGLSSPVAITPLEEVQNMISVLKFPHILSATVVAEGGVCATLLQMCGRSEKGANITASFPPHQWFSENPGIVVEVSPEKKEDFLQHAKKYSLASVLLGEVRGKGESFDVKNVGVFDVQKISDMYWNGLRRRR